MSRANLFRGSCSSVRRAAGWLLLAGLLIPGARFLAAQEYPHRTYTFEDGLPSSRIRDITQDAVGQLWVATHAGVVAWDGREWKTYNVAHGLSWAEQFALRWDAEGRLLAVSQNAPFRLFSFDGVDWNEEATLDEDTAVGSQITAFEVQRLGKIGVSVIGTATDGLLLYRAGQWWGMGVQQGLPDDRVTALGVYRGRFLIGTLGGLAELTSAGQIRRISTASMPTEHVTGLAWEEYGNQCWVLGDRWVGRLVGGVLTLLAEDLEIPEPLSPKKAVADGQGGLYFGNHRVLFYFHPVLGLERLGRENGLPTEGASALFLDREDNLWVGGARGLTKITTRRFSKYTRRQGLLDDEVTAVIERRDGEIFLAHRGGLSRLRGNRVDILHLAGAEVLNEVQRIQDLAEDVQGNLWVAARQAGLGRIGPGGEVEWIGAEQGLPGAITSLRVDRAGRLWVGSDRGVFLRRGQRFERPTGESPQTDVRRIFEGPSGQIRLATESGLFELRFEDGTREGELAGPQWRHWECEVGPCNSVFAALERPGGGVWVGTAAGLFRTDGDRLVAEGSPKVQRPVYFMVKDRAGRFWFGTDNGVERWDGRRLERFTVREGMTGGETYRAAGMMDSRGRLWFGTEQGVTVYNEGLPAPIRGTPFLELVAVEVSGRRLPADVPLTLDFKDNDLAFHYRVVSLVDETQIRIGYQLEGLEDHRVALSGAVQEVRYPNLEPGEYRFRIAAGTVEDHWTEDEVTAPIVILRPLSQRPWFYLALAALLAFAVVAVQSFFGQRRYSRHLEAEVAQRLDELHASEERYRRIFERNRAAMLILDGDELVIADANRAACLFYGYQLDEIKGLTHQDLLVVEDLDSFERLSMESRTHMMVERHRMKHGEVRDVETYASAIVVEGRPTLFVIVHDVTARRLVEESMLTEKERLAITLRHIDDGVVTMDAQGEILLLNRKAEEIAEWSSSEVVGRPLGRVLRLYEAMADGRIGKRLRFPWEELAGASVSGTVFKSIPEAILRTRGGGQRLLELSGSPIQQLSGEVSGWVLAFRDITEKKQIEEELVRAQKMEALGILAGGIAHDFNNLLTVLLGNLSLLSTGVSLGPRGQKNLENAESAVMRARDLAQQLLTFSSGGAPVRKAASMAEVIRESASFVLRGSAVRAKVEGVEDLWVVEIDPGQINQVLNNLLINAMQAMPAGGTVRIRGENLEHPPGILSPGRHVAIHIFDEGMGIDLEHLDRIFDPYFSTKEGGRGLGLTSAYSIIKQHGGLLTVQSEPGVGTTFSIYLPAAVTQLEKVSQPSEVTTGGSGRILVMDDDDGVRLVLESIVERLGYEPVATVDGEGAIARYREGLEEGEPFAAVIMDLTIPGGMGGQEALEHLLRLDPGVRAIVVSGYSNNPVLAHYQDYGFKGRVSKPFRPEELGNVLAQVLREDVDDGE